jgi:tetratricopeptide (TPR) repeat protein
MNNLATSYMGSLDLTAARDVYAEHLERTIEVYGEGNLATARSKSNLGMVLSQLGEMEKAEPLQLEAIRQQGDLLGSRHPITLRSRSNDISTLIELGRFEEAIISAENVELLQTEVLGEFHFDTLFTRLMRAYALASAKHSSAEVYLAELEQVLIRVGRETSECSEHRSDTQNAAF